MEQKITVIYLFNASDYQDHLDDLIRRGIKMQKQKEREKEAEAKKIKIKAKKNKTPKVDVENVEKPSKKARNITDPEQVVGAAK